MPLIKLLKKYFILILVLLEVFTCSKVFANAQNDLGSWNALNILLPINKKFETRFQISPRLLDNWSDFNQQIYHAIVGYKVTDKLSVWQGYAFSQTFIPTTRIENRPYNDILYESNFKKLQVDNRIRIEERFFEDLDDVAIRSRYRLRFMYPLPKLKDTKIVLFDEVFFNLNDASGGPQSGFDQNRIYIGLNKELNQIVSIDGAYFLQHTFSGQDRLNHFLYAGVNLKLPQLIK